MRHISHLRVPTLAVTAAIAVAIVAGFGSFDTGARSDSRAAAGSVNPGGHHMTTTTTTTMEDHSSGMEMPGMTELAPGANGTHASAGGVTLDPGTTTLPAGRTTAWTLRIVDAHGMPVTRFQRDQTKLMHLIVVRDDLAVYQHLHPVLGANGKFTVPINLPTPGRYRAVADFTTGGKRYALGVGLTAPGKSATVALPAASRTATVDGYRVTMAHGMLMG